MAILTEGTMGTSPYGVISGSTDLGYSAVGDVGLGASSMVLTGENVISLGDLLTEPSLAMSQIMSNAKSNAVPMAIGAITFNAGAKIFRKTMAKPFREANKLIRPLGLGVRL